MFGISSGKINPFALSKVEGRVSSCASTEPVLGLGYAKTRGLSTNGVGHGRLGARSARPILLAATLLAAVPAGAATTPAKPTQAELANAQKTLSLIVSALNSNDVPQGMKDGLFGCLYENPLKKISASAAQVWTDNKKLDPRDATAQLLVVAKVCGAPLPKVADQRKPAKGR
jgi:hypothetical protein